MKKDGQFYRDMQNYIAITTIGASTLRNQGAKGVIKAAQKHLADINLRIFQAKNEFAKQVASEQGISRIHLDMRLWIEARKRNDEQDGQLNAS